MEQLHHVRKPQASVEPTPLLLCTPAANWCVEERLVADLEQPREGPFRHWIDAAARALDKIGIDPQLEYSCIIGTSVFLSIQT